MQAKGSHAHGGDPVGGVGHQVGVSPYGGWGRHQGHCVGEAGGRVGQGEPRVGEGQPGEGFRLERNLIERKKECAAAPGPRGRECWCSVVAGGGEEAVALLRSK